MEKERKVKWKPEDLISLVQKIFKEHGPLSKYELNNRKKEFGLCSIETIRTKFDSTNKFAEYAGIEFKPTGKGITLEEKYGKKRADEIRIKRGKGKTLEEKYGKEKADKIKEKNTKYKPEDLISLVQKIFKEHGPLSKGELEQRKKKFGFCGIDTIKKNFGSLDKLAEYAGIEFKPTGKGITLEERYGKKKADKLKIKYGKGQTFEQRFGKVKSDKLKNKMHKWCKGKTYKEIYGKEKADKLKINLSKKNKGKTLEEIHGKEKADKIKINLSKKNKGKTFEDIHGKEKADKIKEKMIKWKPKDLITLIQDIFKEHGPLSKCELQSRRKEFNFCSIETIRTKFDSADKFARYAGIEFKINGFGIGSSEQRILDYIEKERGIHLERQYNVNGKRIDGYDSKNNTAYEVDEPHHKNQLEEDLEREIFIKEKIDCKFVRINEREYLNKIRNKVLGDFL